MLRILMRIIRAFLDLRDVFIFFKTVVKKISMLYSREYSTGTAYDIAVTIIITGYCEINVVSIGIVIYKILPYVQIWL